ncbi:hypothetical protein H0H93_013216 [Arthromyces matolae]|nr:hypothetical protein H0H93_013216 [Arthromyces matolae]
MEPTHSTQYLSRMTREEDQEEIIQICLNAFITKDWKPLQKHRTFSLPVSINIIDLKLSQGMFDPVIDEERLKEQTIGKSLQHCSAAQKSWEAPFLGDGPKALLEHIAKWHCAHNKRQDTIYGNYFSIVQSSGMGKSRLIDEFSRTNVVIPMNLGDSKAYGYPPPDKELAKALVALKPESFQLRIAALRTFLTVLFECALAPYPDQ